MKIQLLSDGLLKAYSYCRMKSIGLNCIEINRIETDLGELVERYVDVVVNGKKVWSERVDITTNLNKY